MALIELSFAWSRPIHELRATVPEADFNLMRLYAARYRYPHQRQVDQEAQTAAILGAVNGDKNATFDGYTIKYYRPVEPGDNAPQVVLEFKPRGKRKRGSL